MIRKKRAVQTTTGKEDSGCWRRKAWWLAALILTLAVITLSTLWPRSRGASIPEINLSGFDPLVAQAIRLQADTVRTQPRSADAWGRLGSMLQAYRLMEPARICLSEAERLDPRNPRWPYFQSLLLATEASDESLRKLRRTVELCGSEPEAPRWRLATLLGEAGRWDDAANETQALLQATPNFAPALLLSARRAQALGQFAEAIALAQRCTDDARTARGAAFLLANLYARQGDQSAASNTVRLAATLPPDDPVADPFQAEAALLRNDPRILAERAHPLLASGRLDQAEPLIQRLMDQHSSNSETWLLAGRLQILKKNYPMAEQYLRRHLDQEPESSQGWFQLGSVRLAQERFTEAADVFLKAAQIKPDYGPAFYNRGYALARAGRLPDALPAFREAVRLNPERIDSYLMLVEMSLRLGETNAIEKTLREAEFLNPAHPGLKKLRQKLRTRP